MIHTSRHCHRWDVYIGKRTWKRQAKHWYNTPLSPLGIQQALGFRERLKDVKKVYVSPFLRCVQTAHFATEGAELCIEYSLMENIRESWFGQEDMLILSAEELSEHYPSINLDYKSFLDMNEHIGLYREGRRSCRKRVGKFLDYIIGEKKEDDIYLVSHGFPTKDCNVRFGLSGKLPKMGQIDSARIEDFQ